MENRPNGAGSDSQSLMDELLRAGVPEIKLALGDAIDRENARPLPARYARLLPDTLLRVTLRQDAADALEPIAGDLERELTDSCNRHGSLYDRSYRVQLNRSGEPDAPLYVVETQSGQEAGDGDAEEAAADVASIPSLERPPSRRADDAALEGWTPGRWVLVVEDDQGEDREVFRLADPEVTVGRVTDDPRYRATIGISDAPHVSRRQLGLVWQQRDGEPGFTVYNIGLNDVHLPDADLPGANLKRDADDPTTIGAEHVGWLPPGVPLTIGESGPTLRIDEVPADPDDDWVDPDATVFE